ncbi:hypothetical protein J6590_040158 [Homalodisca vitripennis]|nr:hypothetical protein J6590_040158 [Homalodisca vitripennis]
MNTGQVPSQRGDSTFCSLEVFQSYNWGARKPEMNPKTPPACTCECVYIVNGMTRTISHADMKNWYSPIIMMEIFGRGVVMSWRENNIKNEEQGREEEVEDRIRKATFGSASACVRVREKWFRRNKCQVQTNVS